MKTLNVIIMLLTAGFLFAIAGTAGGFAIQIGLYRATPLVYIERHPWPI